MPVLDTLRPEGSRDFLDFDATRGRIFDGVLSAAQTSYPKENARYKLELGDLAYEGPDKFSLKDQKDAILRRKSMYRKLTGTWKLTDKATGAPIDEKKTTIANVPYMTQRGTFIVGGNEYTVSNQMRLHSGVFARKKDNGEFEAHFNILKGGPGFRVYMEPDTGLFRMQVGQSKLKLYPIMRALGIKDPELQAAWGNESYIANALAGDGQGSVDKAIAKLGASRSRKGVGETVVETLPEIINRLELNPKVTSRTLGKPYDRVSPEVLTEVTKKLLKISKGEAETDDRDSLAYQETLGPEDFFQERIAKDAGQLGAKMLWRATLLGNLSRVPHGALSPQLDSVFFKSGLSQPLEETNPMDALDLNLRVLRLGEGGISSEEAVPHEARNVQPSHFMFIDPIRAPESTKIGVDTRLAYGAIKGKDRKVYAPVIDAKTGALTYQPPDVLSDSVIAFPGARERAARLGMNRIEVMAKGRIRYAKPEEVDFFSPSSENMFTIGSNLIPMSGAIKGGRMLMGGKMVNQALPMQEPEAPLVQSAATDGHAFVDELGKHTGAVFAKGGGEVLEVTPDGIVVKGPTGKESYELYNNFPLNRKTYEHSTPLVKPGDVVQPGQVLARSNFTDNKGALALGKNLRVGYLPYRGLNFEDAVVISQSAAKKLSSEHMYTDKIDTDEHTDLGRDRFRVMFPSVYKTDQLSKLDENGVIRPGSRVEKGDPLALAVSRKPTRGAGMLHRSGREQFSDASVTWKHEAPGIVTDAYTDEDGVKVAVRAYAPSEVGDKLAGRYGDKGVISKVIPDDDMPHTADGKPLDIIVNHSGTTTRTNPAQIHEAILGKIAQQTGSAYKLKDFQDLDLRDFVRDEMKKHGVSATEDLVDPATRRRIKNVLVGNRFYMKLHHTAEGKMSERGLGSYTSEGTPAAGIGEAADNPKRIGLGEMAALISHGVPHLVEEIKTIRGQRNDNWWRQLMQGYAPPTPDVPNMYKKLLVMMQGAGINVDKRGEYTHLSSMTDKDIDRLSAGEITSPATVKWLSEYGREAFGDKSMNPVDGGLFDRSITGGHGGNRFSHVTLTEPLPQPAMEDPIRTLLGLTKDQYSKVISGEEELPGVGSGGKAIKAALSRIDMNQSIDGLRTTIQTASRSKRDAAIKQLKYLEGLKAQGIDPADMVVSKALVIPPFFRPITATSKFDMVAGVNKLYQDMMRANDNLKEISSKVTGPQVGIARKTLYDSFKAVTGLGDPVRPEHVSQGVTGLLTDVFGEYGPKAGLFQRKLMGGAVDVAARAVITPNPNLDMDHIGMPEEAAWSLYAPFIVRRLVKQSGTPEARTSAIKAVSDRTPQARHALVEEMKVRPVLATRAPALHRFSLMAFYPVLTAEKTLQLSPPVCPGFNADYDGDAMNFHVVCTDKGVKEATERMLPSKNLRSPADFATLWSPRQEFLEGLYRATTANKKGMPRVFADVKDVLAAYHRGEIDAGDRVIVKDKNEAAR